MGTRLGTALDDVLGTRAGTPLDAPHVWGITDFDTSTRLAPATNGHGLLGHVNGHWLRVLFWPTSVSGAIATRTFMSSNDAATGQRMRTNGTNVTLQYGAFFTGPTERNTSNLTLTAAMVGKLLDVCYVYDQPNAVLLTYLQALQIDSVGATGAYLPGTVRMTVGSSGTSSSPCTDNVIAAIEGGDGFIPTAAELMAAHKATRARVAAGQTPFAGIPGKTTYRAQMRKSWNPPVVVRDEIAGQDLTLVTGTAANLVLASTRGVWA